MNEDFLDVLIEVWQITNRPFKGHDGHVIKKTFNRSMARGIVRDIEKRIPQLKQLAETVPVNTKEQDK